MTHVDFKKAKEKVMFKKKEGVPEGLYMWKHCYICTPRLWILLACFFFFFLLWFLLGVAHFILKLHFFPCVLDTLIQHDSSPLWLDKACVFEAIPWIWMHIAHLSMVIAHFILKLLILRKPLNLDASDELLTLDILHGSPSIRLSSCVGYLQTTWNWIHVHFVVLSWWGRAVCSWMNFYLKYFRVQNRDVVEWDRIFANLIRSLIIYMINCLDQESYLSKHGVRFRSFK